MNTFAHWVESGPILVSLLLSIFGTLILVIPIWMVNYLAKRYVPKWRFTLTGAVFGMLALPISFWFYFHYFVGPIRALILGFPGLFMLMWHTWPLGKVPIPFLLEATDTSKGSWGMLFANQYYVSALVWTPIYGLIGLVFDFFRNRKTR